MQYRSFGKLDWKASALGFGCMRFPTLDGTFSGPNIDEPEALRMVRHAIDSGVNYVDTAFPYHGANHDDPQGGQSEIVVGKALKDGYRDKVKLATKLPVWMVQSTADFDKYLNMQLSKLGTDHIDFYLLHALDHVRWQETVVKYNLLKRVEAALADGRIRNIGFSFHGNYEAFEEVINGSDLWNFCQIQYNYMDTENQAGTKGLKLAASKGLGVVIMEPLMGGRLANPPQDVREAMDTYPEKRSAAEWALQWLWDQPEVSVVLSGMGTMAQVDENIGVADRSRIGSFGLAEQAIIAQAVEKYRARTAIPCTRCGYCMPCPNGVNIPGNFDFFNYAHLYDDVKTARFRYQMMMPEPQRAASCINCDICEDLCPQKIPISDWMPKVSSLLG